MTSLDKATAIRMFREIKDQLENLDPESITVYLTNPDGDPEGVSVQQAFTAFHEALIGHQSVIESLENSAQTLDARLKALETSGPPD